MNGRANLTNINNVKVVMLTLMLFGTTKLLSQDKILLEKIDTSSLVNELRFEGKIKEAIKWKDNLGDNIVFITETGQYPSRTVKDEDYRDAELFAYHYIIQNEKFNLTWKVHDFQKECPIELYAEFLKNILQVTDLNNDRVGEVWLMYQTVCHGDVSPMYMKIIMYQGQQKFAIKGRTKVLVKKEDNGKELYVGGEYEFDQAFHDGPKEFFDFAKKLWNEHITGE